MSVPLWLAAGLAGAGAGVALVPTTRRILRREQAAPAWHTTTVTVAGVAAGAAIWAVLTWRIPAGAVLVAGWWLATLAVPLTVVDLSVRRLPDAFVLPSYPAVAGILAAFAVHDGQWWTLVRAVLAAAVATVVGLVLALAMRDQMGLGDVKLAGLTALVTGAHSWAAVAVGALAAFLAAACVGAVAMLAGRATMRTRYPFGPYLLGGAVMVLIALPPPL
jgi:leader peptidase (prepilin peptidase) / N-methyltransferase